MNAVLFLSGATTLASFTIGLFFLRFWAHTRDRLFAFFAMAFWLMAVNRAAIAFFSGGETQPRFYVLRLAAFAIIAGAVIDKNRRR